MLLDTIHGVIARRVLLNFRIDAEVIAKQLPHPFRPKLYRGHAIGGVCIDQLRPRFAPAWMGMCSENAAHRIAVEWEEGGVHREGVFIPQRNTASKINKTLGGRLFPGVFSLGRFQVQEDERRMSIRIFDDAEIEQVRFAGEASDEHTTSSVFPTLDEAANFFSLGATGYSVGRDGSNFEGMELRSLSWKVSPVRMVEAYSRWFADRQRFPDGAVKFD